MMMERSEFEAAILAAHNAGLVELARLDLVGSDDARYIEESEIKLGAYEVHFVRAVCA